MAGRLRIAGVRLERGPGRVSVTVSLGHDGAVITGRADRAGGEVQTVPIAAEAALNAVRQVAPGRARWGLEQAMVQPLAGGQAVVVHILLETEEGASEHLIGSALGRRGPLEEAAAEAVLDAVERRLSGLVKN
ncbi:MAG: hypothetical protein QN141_06260 [Armatimonadota bacterium]|nr:hypothetical protein [Armatimonadota bacterium]MDR7451901.1 hypothetical protein [Armatimonadota bacterium]MDR7466583.1 hypothetical protein [Armatimonadota bacterium]MDR7495095.1 hypothetical protein [Armatimonadota bacterium]MDR7500169.1 hypothetical protein [Armatimonadota bacterium]